MCAAGLSKKRKGNEPVSNMKIHLSLYENGVVKTEVENPCSHTASLVTREAIEKAIDEAISGLWSKIHELRSQNRLAGTEGLEGLL